MLKAVVVVTIACLGSVSFGGITGQAQVTQGRTVVVAPQASVSSVNFMQTIEVARFTLRPVKGGTLALRLSVPLDRFSQASRSKPSKAHTRSKKRIFAGAIAGAVGGFFAGGFLGAHIEGDRCDCDDPGVRGFLIGAPTGAVLGAIAGGKFLF